MYIYIYIYIYIYLLILYIYLLSVFKTTTETYEELLKRAKLPTLHNRRLQDIAILMYKVKNDLVPSYISEIFTRKGTRYNLRNSDFEIPRFNTIRYGKHTLRYQGPYIWSKLENGMRELPSLSIFKTKIRRVDLASLVEDSGNCCNLCSTWFFLIICIVQVFLCYLNIVNISKYF